MKRLVLVNLITFLRIIGSFLLIYIFNMFGPLVTAGVFLGFIATDFIDGFLARKFKVSTFFGALLDALSDKLFVVISLVLASSINPQLIIPIILEFGILLVGTYSAIKGNKCKSSMIGKSKVWVLAICTFLTFILGDSITIQLFNKLDVKSFMKFLCGVTSVAEMVTLGDYIIKDNKETKKVIKQESISKKERYLKEKKMINDVKDNMISNDELKNRLFSPQYYQEHKDDSMRLLLKK